MGFKTKTALAVLALIGATSAMAQANYTLTGNVGVVSDYRFRGITQTAGMPSLQAGADFAHKNGFYAGVWGATGLAWIKDFNGAKSGEYEVDVYGGYKGQISGDLSYDLGVITYQYPGNDSGVANVVNGNVIAAGAYSKADTTEWYVGISYKMFTLKVNTAMGNFLGNNRSDGAQYIDLSANFDLGGGYTLTPHLGKQTIPNQNFTNNGFNIRNGTAADYQDYSLTLAKDFGNGVVASIAATGTDAKDRGFYVDNKNKFLANSALVLGLKYNF